MHLKELRSVTFRIIPPFIMQIFIASCVLTTLAVTAIWKAFLLCLIVFSALYFDGVRLRYIAIPVVALAITVMCGERRRAMSQPLARST